MTEQKKKAECPDLAVEHSARGQNLMKIITNISTLIRGIAKLVELTEILIGETKLARQAQEKQAEQTKRIADSLECMQSTIDVKNELISDIRRHVNGMHGNTAVLQPEVSRIVDGLKLRHTGDFHV